MPVTGQLLPGVRQLPTRYEVANSLRLDGSSSNLSRTKGTSDSTKIGTYSWWIKNSKFSGQNLINCGDAFANSSAVYISSSNTLTVFSRISNSNVLVLETDREFRDPSAWHNIVVAIDTTQGTASNRVKVYVDGVQQTSFSTETYPDQNADLRFFTSSETEKISSSTFESSGYFGGYMCEVVKVDGQALAPTSFGEFDEDSPTIWKPIDVSGLTFGTNGYYLDFEDSSNLGNNVSGGTDFTENNIAATDQSTDTCTNNFATLNPLNVPTSNAPTFSDGNLTSSTSDSAQFGGTSTIGVSSGKWYAEFKGAETGVEEKEMVGVTHAPAKDARSGDNVGRTAESFAIRFLDGQQSNNNNASAYGSSFSLGDICQVALDVDNNQLYFGKNGQWGDGSGNFNQSTPTSAITIPTIANTTEGAYFFSVGDISSSSGRSLISCNFGSPPYSISSGNADANGHGNFEYSVPSGYFALCSKNLAEFG